MLKHADTPELALDRMPAAFRRLCVETADFIHAVCGFGQPPSGGCVLKLSWMSIISILNIQPPSGGCVLKHRIKFHTVYQHLPAAFRRLGVETPATADGRPNWRSSRLQAAVC